MSAIAWGVPAIAVGVRLAWSILLDLVHGEAKTAPEMSPPRTGRGGSDSLIASQARADIMVHTCTC